MKFLVGAITGIVLAAGGVAYASNTHQTTAVSDLAQVRFAPQIPQTETAATRLQLYRGELERKDNGAFELKIGERDLRIIVAHASVTNLAGRPVRLPLDEANARVSGKLLPRSAWRLDDEGQLLPTIAAQRVVVIAIPQDETDQNEG
jgi:hypothetical protein